MASEEFEAKMALRDNPQRLAALNADDLVDMFVWETSICSTYQHARKLSKVHPFILMLKSAAVPALLRNLRDGNGNMHTMHLLGELTGEWPSQEADTPIGDTGFVGTNVAHARDLWIQWGYDRQLLSD